MIDPIENIFLSVSATERAQRCSELEGRDYYFKTSHEFSRMIAENQFLEWAKYGNHRYGTPLEPAQRHLNDGVDVLLEIEVQGAMTVKQNYPDAVFIFVVPPHMVSLQERLFHRNTESDIERLKRIELAREEFSYLSKYDYIVINDRLSEAVSKIRSIIIAERCNATRYSSDMLKDRFTDKS